MKRFLLSLFLISIITSISSQTNFPYKIELEPAIFGEFRGLQSFAWARSGKYILLVGGRTDGLHRRQPFAAFNQEGNNMELIVLDPIGEMVWKQSVSPLPGTIAEQLQSTNMQFSQDGNILVLAGGYGYSELKGDHITHPYLARLQVKEIVDAILAGRSVQPFISQVKDERMAVTGGQMEILDNRFFLVGGHRFDGRYNPHGPSHGPGFRQNYTNQVRMFSVEEDGKGLRITGYSTFTDSLLLHRRDANLLMQVDEDGGRMLTIFSGVFQPGKDEPYTTMVDIKGDHVSEVPGFNQLYSHYHTASLPVYDVKNRIMYSIFFGGIARNYLDTSGSKIQDDRIPFVRSISVVERGLGGIKEYVLPYEMPGYFGAAAEFIPVGKELYLEDGILDPGRLGEGRNLIGFIIGGIDSRAPNVFWGNDSDDSRASPVIWKVYMNKKD